MRRLAAFSAVCLVSCWGSSACAQSDIFSPATIHGQIDVRASAADGEDSLLEGGFGKLRYGGKDGELEPRIEVAAIDLAWTPQLAWGLSGVVSATHQAGLHPDVDVSEAYLKYRTGPGETRVSARAGLFWPPVSLEHGGPMWLVEDTITPSAINSWVGEEVKIVAAEITIDQQVGDGEVSASGAVFRNNDTSGTLLSYRGWAQHDVRVSANGNLPLPPLSPMIAPYQAAVTNPMLELDGRVGYYARLEWRPALPIRVNLFRYDNRGDRVTGEYSQTAWRTRFWNVGAAASLGERTTLKTQALWGNTLVGPDTPIGVPVDVDFRSAYVLLGRKIGAAQASARVDWFETIDNSYQFADDNTEDGWSAMLALKRPIWRHADALAEVIHVESDRAGRALYGAIAPARQAQTLMQASLRFHL